MEFQLNLTACTHHQWYLPGDVVKVRATFSCTPKVRQYDSGGIVARGTEDYLVPLPPLFSGNYFSLDHLEENAEEVDIVIEKILAEACGSVTISLDSIKAIDWPAPAPPKTTDRTPHQQRTHYQIYRSPKWPISEPLSLRRHQCVAVDFSFRLPEGCPPSHDGYTIRFQHLVQLSASWCTTRGTRQLRSPKVKLQLPILVYNSMACLTMLPLLSLFPLAITTAAAGAGYSFDFECHTLAPVPSPVHAAPIQDAMDPAASQLRTSLTVRQDAIAAWQERLAKSSDPLTFTVPYGSDDGDLVCIVLQSSTLAIGDVLRGTCTVPLWEDKRVTKNRRDANQNRRERSPSMQPTPVKMIASLEVLECVTPEWVVSSADTTPVEGVDNLVCVSKREVSVAEFVLLDTLSTPFIFAIPSKGFPTSMMTDITCIVWQLRLSFTTMLKKALSASRNSGRAELAPVLKPVELILPLSVVPPQIPCKPRFGLPFSSSSAP